MTRVTIAVIVAGTYLMCSVSSLGEAICAELGYRVPGSGEGYFLAFDLKEFLTKTKERLQKELDRNREKDASEEKKKRTEEKKSTARREVRPRKTKSMTRKDIREIQQRLTALGLRPGIDDGLMGKKTATAISQYQKITGLPVNGLPSKILLINLREKTPGLYYRPPRPKPITPTESIAQEKAKILAPKKETPITIPGSTPASVEDDAVDLDNF